MRYLLDVNVLVAWGWSDHLEHERTVNWIATLKTQKDTLIYTSAIPQLGFVRVSIQRTGGHLTVKDASETLAGMLGSLGQRHLFLSDDRSAEHFPKWCHSAAQTTDAHLLDIAEEHGLKLAILDTQIPSAFLIPFPVIKRAKP